MSIDLLEPSDVQLHAGPFYGGRMLGDGQARFCIWAPDASDVQVVIGATAYPMQRDAEDNFSVIAPADAGAHYRYLIDGKQRVPDPASRFLPDGVNGPSALLDDNDYDWQHTAWQGRPWHETVLCELHVGTLGGYNGVRAKLPELARSGYTAIELMPLSAFDGQRNWGYDGVQPYAPVAAYGTPAELKALIDEAHGLGLSVLLDVVYNHFGPVGNYLGVFASGFFREDLPTPWGAAIDFRKPQVARYFIDNALMWLQQYRFDGLRFDAVHAIQPKAFLDQLGAAIRNAIPATRDVHLVLENEHNSSGLLRGHSFDAQWDDDGHNALHVMLTREHEGYYADYSEDPTDAVATMLSEGFVFQGQPDRRGVRRGEPTHGLHPQNFVLFLQNHDQVGNRPMGERLIALSNEADLRAATVLLALSPLVPMFFMGEEWGCRTPFYFFTDYHDELAEAVREGRRREFAHFSGFTDEAARARIPDPNAASTFEASIPRVDDAAKAEAWRSWFAHLLALRTEHLWPHLPGSEAIGSTVLADGALVARWRLNDGCIWEIALNVSDQDVAYIRSDAGEVIWAEPANAAAQTDWLPPHAAIVSLKDLQNHGDSVA